MRKYLLFIILIILICWSCATPKFSDAIKSTYLNEINPVFPLKSQGNPHSKVFKTFRNELKNSKHIVYLYAPNNDWNNKDFSGAIYDVENSKYYYFQSNLSNSLKMTVIQNYSFPDDNYYRFVIDNFINGKKSYLEELGQISNHSGVRTKQIIFDLNLRTGKSVKFIFKDFLFMNGKPTKDIDKKIGIRCVYD